MGKLLRSVIHVIVTVVAVCSFNCKDKMKVHHFCPMKMTKYASTLEGDGICNYVLFVPCTYFRALSITPHTSSKETPTLILQKRRDLDA